MEKETMDVPTQTTLEIANNIDTIEISRCIVGVLGEANIERTVVNAEDLWVRVLGVLPDLLRVEAEYWLEEKENF